MKSYNEPFLHVDYNAIIDGTRGNGVQSGLIVTERGAGQNMSVDVATGSAIINKLLYTEVGITNIVISPSHTTLPRRDIIIYDIATTNPIVITGIPSSEPIPPNITSGDILLAIINVAATVTVITNLDIYDSRVLIATHADTHYHGGYDAMAFYDVNDTSVLDDNSTQRLLTASLIKEKETQINTMPDAINIQFSLSVYTTGASIPCTSHGRIYRNGVAVGTQRSISNSGVGGTHSSSWSEIINGWSDGDLIQLYCYKSGSGQHVATCYVYDFQILGINTIIYCPVQNIIHQDP